MQRQDATKKSIGPILFLYHEESPVSSNLNSNLFRFHCVRPNVDRSCCSKEIVLQDSCNNAINLNNILTKLVKLSLCFKKIVVYEVGNSDLVIVRSCELGTVPNEMEKSKFTLLFNIC